MRPVSKYSRIYSKYLKYEEWDDIEQLVEIMNSRYADAKAAEKKIVSIVEKFKW